MAADVIRIGVITPHAAKGPEAEFPAIAPGRIETSVVRLADDDAPNTGGGASPRRPVGRRAMTDARLDEAAERLAAGGIDAIGYASTSYAYTAGFANEAAMVSRLSRGAGVPVAATCAAAVLALRTLDIRRVALVHPPWFDDALNDLGAAYFRSQGTHVVSSASADLPDDPRQIEPGDVCHWTSRHVGDDADAVFIGGNGFPAAGAIAPLELAIGRPVLAANQVLLWRLLALADAMFSITGYGQLLATKRRGLTTHGPRGRP
jgi:maleate isomerase